MKTNKISFEFEDPTVTQQDLGYLMNIAVTGQGHFKVSKYSEKYDELIKWMYLKKLKIDGNEAVIVTKVGFVLIDKVLDSIYRGEASRIG